MMKCGRNRKPTIIRWSLIPIARNLIICAKKGIQYHRPSEFSSFITKRKDEDSRENEPENDECRAINFVSQSAENS